MSKELLERLDQAHKDEQEFNLETYGEREFDPEEPTLYSEAAAEIRRLLSEQEWEYAVFGYGRDGNQLHSWGDAWTSSLNEAKSEMAYWSEKMRHITFKVKKRHPRSEPVDLEEGE